MNMTEVYLILIPCHTEREDLHMQFTQIHSQTHTPQHHHAYSDHNSIERKQTTHNSHLDVPRFDLFMHICNRNGNEVI